jgi:hypothetical protein
VFETSQYKYRVFVTDFAEPIDFVVWFYSQRGGAGNLFKEANNDAGLAACTSGRFDVNGNHFQLAMLAYNLNCWLMLFNRERRATSPHYGTPLWRLLGCASCLWRPRSGATPAALVELQRSLRGEGHLRALDGPAAMDYAASRGIRAGDGTSPAVIQRRRLLESRA